MGRLGRYILRLTSGAFLLALVALTGVVWLTQALRELDVITDQGQGFAIFLTMTSLAMPVLIAIIAPVAIFIAVVFALTRLDSDSELAVMAATGTSPWRLARPFLLLAALVATLVAVLVFQAGPAAQRELRALVTAVRADVVSSFLRAGQFVRLEDDLVFNVRSRGPGGALAGLIVDDRRDAQTDVTYIARRGFIIRDAEVSYLVMEDGIVTRRNKQSGDVSFVAFQRYALDLAAFSREPAAVLKRKPKELGIAELIRPSPQDAASEADFGRLRSELHDRFTQPLHVMAFVMVALAALGRPRTTRQGRGLAVTLAVAVVIAERVAAFAAASLALRSPAAVYIQWAVPLLVIAVSALVICGIVPARAPWALRRLGEEIGGLGERLAARFGLGLTPDRM